MLRGSSDIIFEMREVYLYTYMRDRSRREYSYFQLNFGAREMLQVSRMIVLLCKKLRIKYDCYANYKTIRDTFHSSHTSAASHGNVNRALIRTYTKCQMAAAVATSSRLSDGRSVDAKSMPNTAWRCCKHLSYRT